MAELVHSIFWMHVTSEKAYFHRKEINENKFVPSLEVASQICFSIESDDDNPELTETFFRKISASGICSVGDTDYEHRAYIELTFNTPTLRETLENSNIAVPIEDGIIIAAFLEEASQFESYFLSAQDDRPSLESLPITMDWFSAPRHFASALDALVTSGYCELDQSGYRWLPKIRPHMETVHLWKGGKTIHQIREARLCHIWDTMPIRFKTVFLEVAKKNNGLDIVSFAFLMGHFWYDEQWHEEPEDLKSLKRGDLRGGVIPTARDLGKLFKEGKLKH